MFLCKLGRKSFCAYSVRELDRTRGNNESWRKLVPADGSNALASTAKNTIKASGGGSGVRRGNQVSKTRDGDWWKSKTG